MSKGGITKEVNIKRDDTEIKRWNLEGGAKVSRGVPRRCQECAKGRGYIKGE